MFYRKGKIKLNKYLILSAFSSFFFATALIIDVDISKQFNLPFYIMLTLIIPGLFIYLTERHPLKKVVREFNSKRKKYYLITGIFYAIMILFNIRALQSSEVIFAAPLLAVSALLNVLVASVMHKETKNLFRKTFAAVIVGIGVFLMVN